MRFVPLHRRHFREPLILPRRCPCGSENVRKGQCIGPACYAAAPANLRREVYSKDMEVVRVAWRGLMDFARARGVGQNLQNSQNSEEGPLSNSENSVNSVKVPAP